MVGYTLPIMDGPAPAEFLRDRLKAFLIFAKTKLLSGGADLDRLAQLRRLSVVRIRQFAVGRPQITAADLAGHLSDPRSGRFDALALETGFVHAEHLAVALPPLRSEEHTSELQSRFGISYAVFCFEKTVTKSLAAATAQTGVPGGGAGAGDTQ